jgi:death-on-curing protein
MRTRHDEPRWLTRVVLDAIHTDQIREHGGLLGLRDEAGLESALARARHKRLYEGLSDLPSLATAYGFGLARNHPYSDGNNRVAFVAMLTFLAINGLDVDATDEDALRTMLALAARRMTESELAKWLRSRAVPSK